MHNAPLAKDKSCYLLLQHGQESTGVCFRGKFAV